MDNDRNITIAGIFSQGVNVDNSLVNGDGCTAVGYSHAEGLSSEAKGMYSHADGLSSNAVDNRSYVWSGASSGDYKSSNGSGTYSIYTGSVGPSMDSIYVDGHTVSQQISSEFSSAFSNGVLLTSNNIFIGANEFASVTANGGIAINGELLQSELSGNVTASTVATSYDAIPNRLATVGYMKNMANHSAAINNGRYVHNGASNLPTGNGLNPIYVGVHGTATASVSTVGSHSNPLFLNGGEMTALTASVGDSMSPLYLVNGSMASCAAEVPDIYSIPRLIATDSTTETIHINGDTAAFPTDAAYDLVVRNWYRIYSNGWCEQGGTIPFQDFTNRTSNDAKETYTTKLLKVPYADTTYQVMMSMWDTTANTNNDTQIQSTSNSIDRFNACQGWNGSGSASHILAYGGIYWKTVGYVSSDTIFHIVNGDSWSHAAQKWNDITLKVKIEVGSRELVLEPGVYRVTLVGRGGNWSSYYVDGHHTGFETGGSGGTIVAEFDITEETAASFVVSDDDSKAKMKLNDTTVMAAGYGSNGHHSGTNVGGTTEILDSFESNIIVNEAGKNGNAVVFFNNVGGSYTLSQVYSRYAELYGTRHGNSSEGWYGHGGGGAATLPPGNALIIFEKIDTI